MSGGIKSTVGGVKPKLKDRCRSKELRPVGRTLEAMADDKWDIKIYRTYILYVYSIFPPYPLCLICVCTWTDVIIQLLACGALESAHYC